MHHNEHVHINLRFSASVLNWIDTSWPIRFENWVVLSDINHCITFSRPFSDQCSDRDIYQMVQGEVGSVAAHLCEGTLCSHTHPPTLTPLLFHPVLLLPGESEPRENISINPCQTREVGFLTNLFWGCSVLQSKLQPAAPDLFPPHQPLTR